MPPRIYGFGKLRLENDGKSVISFPTRQVEELFGFLILHQGVNHPREKIVNLLWPNYPVQSARSRLSTVLWRLKKVLLSLDLSPDDYLQATRDSITLPAAAPLRLDVDEFTAHLSRAAAANGDKELESSLAAAVALYHGDLFEGLYADWCLLEREHLYRVHLRAMGQLMACLMRNEEYDQAIDLGEQILGLDPLREEVHRALMRCYWKMGQHATAARQFERCTELLEEELGIGPTSDTIYLYTAIVEDRLRFVQADAASRPADEAFMVALMEFRAVVARFNRLLDLHVGKQS